MHAVLLSNLFTCALGLRMIDPNSNPRNDDLKLSLRVNCTLPGIRVEYLSDKALLKQQESEGDDCSEPPVMWSRGFSRACCNVFVKCYQGMPNGEGAMNEGWRRDSSFAKNIFSSPNYNDLLKELSEPDVKVYIPSLNMKDFMDTFVKLPSTASVILVTGQEDVGVPRELWGEGRREFNPSITRPSVGYREFIADPRLKHWFTQNYDLTGCMAFGGGCSNISEADPLAQKVTPIPIGIDLHTLAEKQRPPDVALVRSQVHSLYDVRSQGKALFEKQSEKLFMPFSNLARDGVSGIQLPIEQRAHWGGSRIQMWQAISSEYMFVCTPFGHGADTHRLWETLLLGSIPVVRTSSLDRLLKQFPVIIVPNWSSVNPDSFQKWKDEIRSRFGPEPFNKAMYEKLGMKFWIDHVHDQANTGSTMPANNKCLPTHTGHSESKWECGGH